MRGLTTALWAEWLKLRRSRMLIITVAVFAFVAVMMGFLMFAVKHPEITGRSATLSAKASAIGKADWPSFLDLLIQIVLALGSIGFAVAASWVFGREYSDRVIKDLLALPIARTTIVTAKFVIVGLWGVLLSATLFAVGLLAGLVVGLPLWSPDFLIDFPVRFGISALTTILLCSPVALVACASRGYILPLGFAVLILVMTNFVAVGLPGIMPYFPWAIPALYSGIAVGEAMPRPGIVSLVVLALTSLLGYMGTVAWWRYSDQT